MNVTLLNFIINSKHYINVLLLFIRFFKNRISIIVEPHNYKTPLNTNYDSGYNYIIIIIIIIIKLLSTGLTRITICVRGAALYRIL